MFNLQGLYWKVTLVLTLALVVPRAYYFITFLGFHKTVYNHTPGHCQHVKNIDVGSEDIQVVHGSLALMTSGLRYMTGYHSNDPFWRNRKGLINIFDFDKPDEGAQPVPIQGNFNTDTFNPHGLSIWRDQGTGNIYVFVVNHLPELKEAIERFEFLPETKVLNYLETISDDQHMHLTNDVVAVGPNSFYFTNFIYNKSIWPIKLEIYSQMKWGSVGFYDGSTKTITLVADNLFMPNGINVSPNGAILYVAVMGEMSIRAYTINNDQSLSLLQDLAVYTCIDNLDIQGNYVMTAGHPVLHKIMETEEKHLTVPSPSQVLRFIIGEDGRLGNMTELYSDDGTTLTASSVAVHYKGKQLLIGTVHSKALHCLTP